MQKLALSFYVFILCATAGSIFTLGAIVAATIFHTETIMGVQLLAKYDAGIIMTRIFEKFNNILIFCCAAIVSYEGWMLFKKQVDKAAMGFAISSVLLSLAFVFYFTPQILLYQKIGAAATLSPEFASLHKFSEIAFKLMLLCLTMLAFVRFSRSIKERL